MMDQMIAATLAASLIGGALFGAGSKEQPRMETVTVSASAVSADDWVAQAVGRDEGGRELFASERGELMARWFHERHR